MTYDEIDKIIRKIGLPYSYYQFEENTAEPPPFICYYYPGTEGFFADNVVYIKQVDLTIELYTDEKSWQWEAKVEEVLDAHEIPWRKTESYIDSEKLFLITYETEVFINGS